VEQENFTSENFTTEELDNFTPEQRAEIAAIEKAVNEFLVDRRHLAYIQTNDNRDKLLGYVEQHGLPITATSLHLAYEGLHDELELLLKQEPLPAPPTQAAPQPTPPNPVRKWVAYRNGQPISVPEPRSL
jgi:hypothetical protein